MRSILNIAGRGFVFFLASLALLTPTAGRGNDDREKLLRQEKALADRIESLKREQDFLLFQKTHYALDSKYLVINISGKTGRLKYKNRVLRNFRVFPRRGNRGKIRQGAATLTRKIGWTNNRKLLVFGESLILQPKSRAAPVKADLPRFSLSRKDFIAIFYALEPGAKAYVFP